MSSSRVKAKDKLDLSKLSARELLLIGESQTLGSQSWESVGSSGSTKSSSFVNSSQGEEEEDEDEVMTEEEEEEESGDSEESEEDDWEVVDDQHVEAQLQKYDQRGEKNGEEEGAGKGSDQLANIPEGGLEVVIPREGVFRKRKEMTIHDILRREMNRERIEFQEYLHKVSVLCQLARGLQLNEAINSEILHGAIKERIKGQSFNGKRLDLSKLEKYMKWFRFHMLIPKPSIVDNLEVTRQRLSDEDFLVYQIMEKTAVDSNYNVMIFAAFLRYLKIDVRLVIALTPIPIKPPSGELMRKPKTEKENGDGDKKKSGKGEKKKVGKESKKDMTKKGKKTPQKPASTTRKNKGRKMISSSESEDEEAKKPSDFEQGRAGQDMWVEVYLIEEERWVSVDVLGGKIICDKQLEMEATKPLTYVLGFDNKGKIKDVTRRYASEWLLGTQKLRVKSDWWDETLKPFRGRRTARDKEEDQYLDEHLLSLPIPKSMSEIKGHPLFVLRRHLLKFEALYPDNPPSVGFIKNEPIYSREYVHTLHTRELWLRQAKVVRIGEAPYKIVKARPKYDRLTGARLPEVPSELYGEWQTEDYIPPIAQDGKVPRNEWGNVELFNEKLLPQGCVHLRLPGLQRIAKKLDIDCAPAVVGFDFGYGGSRPAFEGFVVCEEFKETLIDAWNQDQDEKSKKEDEKRLQKIYTNWRKLVKGVLIRDRLEKKYSINLSGKRKANDQASTVEPSTSSSSKKTRRK